MAQKRKPAKGKQAKTNGPTIKQITPIIIKGGDSLHFESALVDFEDDDGKKVPHFKIGNRGRIAEVSIKAGVASVTGNGSAASPLDIKFNSPKAVIVISFLRE